MKETLYFNLIFLGLSCMSIQQNDKLERVFFEQDKEVTHWLSKIQDKSFEFTVLPANRRIRLNEFGFIDIYKKSFLDSDSSIYSDSVTIMANIFTEPSDIMRIMEKDSISVVTDVKFLIEYKLEDTDGNDLTINKKEAPMLLFAPSTGIYNSSYGKFNPKSGNWSLPVSLKPKTPKVGSFSEGYIKVIDLINNDTFYRDVDGNVILPDSPKLRDTIGYYLNLTSSGIWWIGQRNSETRNKMIEFEVKLNYSNIQDSVSLTNPSLYLYQCNNWGNSYLKAKMLDPKNYRFGNTYESQYFIIPNNRKLLIFGYCFDRSGNVYSVNRVVKTKDLENIELIMSKSSKESFLNQLQSICN